MLCSQRLPLIGLTGEPRLRPNRLGNKNWNDSIITEATCTVYLYKLQELHILNNRSDYIVSRYDAILDESERAHLYNNYTYLKLKLQCVLTSLQYKTSNTFLQYNATLPHSPTQ